MKWFVLTAMLVIFTQQPPGTPASAWTAKSKRSQVSGQAEGAKGNNQDSDNRTPLPSQTFIYNDQTAPPYSERNKQQADQDAQVQGKIKTFTGLLVAVGVLQVLVLALQLWLIYRQDEHFRNSERAWVMAELGWYEKGIHIQEGTTRNRDDTIFKSTIARVKLSCKNEGRSPAWIDNVYGRVDIVASASLEDDPQRSKLSKLGSFGTMGPIGPGGEKSTSLELRCHGHRGKDEFLSAYVVIEYHDIFHIKRTTTLGYTVNDDAAYRQDGLPERNRNT